jgi:hypothetical protein
LVVCPWRRGEAACCHVGTDSESRREISNALVSAFFFFLDATAHTESDYINAQYQFIVTGLFYYFLASSGCVIGGWRVYIEDMLRLPSHDAERDESCLVFI